jgi:predicted SAM-dependent methyltransferase
MFRDAAKLFLKKIRRQLRRQNDAALLAGYFSAHQGARKLHIGCGGNQVRGWLNTDYLPGSRNVFHLDATRTFPFADGQFDYVFSEHMIEHVSYARGMTMLEECRRVLKPGGKIRISTPDLAFLVGLYSGARSATQRAYVSWACDELPEVVPADNPAFVVNNFVRNWGHTFIYDETTLRAALIEAGLTDIRRCDLQKSDRADFRGLENETRLPPGFLQLETLTLEATKSGAATRREPAMLAA